MGQEAGFDRLSMQPGGGGVDFLGDRQLPLGRYSQRESPGIRGGLPGHMYTHSAGENIHDSFSVFQDDLRSASPPPLRHSPITDRTGPAPSRN